MATYPATGIVAQAPGMNIDTGMYTTNKANQLNATGYQGRSDWTAAEVAKVLSDSGMTPEEHYSLYGQNEGISTTELQGPTNWGATFAQDGRLVPAAQVNSGSGGIVGSGGGTTSSGGSGGSSGGRSNWQQQINNTPMPINTMRSITPQETVAWQLDQLIDEDSPLMQSARNEALAQANDRGLVNSSLAVQAGQKAVIDTAAPIAAQDASTYAASGLSAQNANQELNQVKYTALLDTVSRSQELSNAMNLAAQQGQINSDLQAQKSAADYQLQTTLKQMDIDVDLQNISSAEKQSFTNAIGNIMQQYQVSYTGIMQQPDSQLNSAAKAAAVADLQKMLNANLSSVANIYSYQVDWGLDKVTVSGLADAQGNPVAQG